MTCEVKYCKRDSKINGLCERHFMKGVRNIAKAIDFQRTRDKPHRATHTVEKREMGY